MCLYGRFHKFFQSLLTSPCEEVQVVARLAARDIRTNLGSNLRQIVDETGLDPWLASNKDIKNAFKGLEAESFTPSACDAWRVPYLWKLLDRRQQAHYMADTDAEQEIDSLIASLVIY